MAWRASVFGYTRFTLLFYVLCVILLANIVTIGMMLVVGKSMWPWVEAALCAAAVGGIMAFVAYLRLRQLADFPAGVNPLEILFGLDVYWRSGQYEGAGYGARGHASDTPTSAL